MKKKTFIYVKFQKEGIHKYPQAADDPQLNDVNFLAYPHRHMFHFKIGIEVFHGDREIEFIQFKRWLESLYGDGILQLDYKSCEMIIDDLYNTISERYPGRDVTLDVSEDDENGAVSIFIGEINE